VTDEIPDLAATLEGSPDALIQLTRPDKNGFS
jgi:hypothetical protein